MKKRLRLIQIAFTLSFLIMVGLSLYSLRQFSQLTNSSERVDHTQKVITHLHHLETLIQDFNSAEQAYILTRDSSLLPFLMGYSRHLQPVNSDLQVLNAKDSQNYHHLTLLRAAMAMRLAIFKEHKAQLDTLSSPPLLPAFWRGQEIQEEAQHYIEQIKTQESSILNERFRGRTHYQQITSDTLRYLLVTFVLVTLFLFLVMLREFKRRLKSQDELQKNLIDLRRSHAELEQIAFAASHDLQEPLRKIRIFGNRLRRLQTGNEKKEATETIERITYAAGRMQELIEDVVNLTSLVREEGDRKVLDLNLILREVVKELAPRWTAKEGNIHQEVLPPITGNAHQIQILFKAILDNAIKFSRPDRPLLISIRADRVYGEELRLLNKSLAKQAFFRITITDNGIGFDNQFSSKIFMIFQRLHNQDSDYEGKGIGLAICQRIMANHNGYILANGHREVGATFKLFFPAES